MKDKALHKEVTAKWTIRLPDDGGAEVKTKKNEKVARGEVLAEIRQTSIVYFDVGEIVKGWGEDKIEQWKKLYEGKKVSEGEVLMRGSAWSGKRIVAPREGSVVTIDEFKQIHFSLNEVETKIIKSPVDAKVSKLESDKICLSFEALEINGDPSGKGKAWGEGKFKLIREITSLKAEHEDKIAFVRTIDQVWLSKSEAIGVKGLVVVSDKNVAWEDYTFGIPVVRISQETFSALIEKLGNENEYRIMLNSNSGRLLVVVQ